MNFNPYDSPYGAVAALRNTQDTVRQIADSFVQQKREERAQQLQSQQIALDVARTQNEATSRQVQAEMESKAMQNQLTQAKIQDMRLQREHKEQMDMERLKLDAQIANDKANQAIATENTNIHRKDVNSSVGLRNLEAQEHVEKPMSEWMRQAFPHDPDAPDIILEKVPMELQGIEMTSDQALDTLRKLPAVQDNLKMNDRINTFHTKYADAWRSINMDEKGKTSGQSPLSPAVSQYQTFMSRELGRNFGLQPHAAVTDDDGHPLTYVDVTPDMIRAAGNSEMELDKQIMQKATGKSQLFQNPKSQPLNPANIKWQYTTPISDEVMNDNGSYTVKKLELTGKKLENTYRKLHPDWSTSTVERAVTETLNSPDVPFNPHVGSDEYIDTILKHPAMQSKFQEWSTKPATTTGIPLPGMDTGGFMPGTVDYLHPKENTASITSAITSSITPEEQRIGKQAYQAELSRRKLNNMDTSVWNGINNATQAILDVPDNAANDIKNIRQQNQKNPTEYLYKSALPIKSTTVITPEYRDEVLRKYKQAIGVQ